MAPRDDYNQKWKDVFRDIDWAAYQYFYEVAYALQPAPEASHAFGLTASAGTTLRPGLCCNILLRSALSHAEFDRFWAFLGLFSVDCEHRDD